MLYTSGEAFAYDKSTYASFEEWVAASGEEGSYCEQTDFLSDQVLEPANEGNLRNALPLAFVSTDLVGTPRDAEHPTIGAYEYSADETAPQMQEGYPAIANITDTTAVAVVKADKSAIIYALVKLAGEEAPAVEDVQKSQNMMVVRSGDVATLTLDSLTKDKEYVAYVVLRGLRGSYSEVYATGKFVAGGEIIVEIPDVAAVAR